MGIPPPLQSIDTPTHMVGEGGRGIHYMPKDYLKRFQHFIKLMEEGILGGE